MTLEPRHPLDEWEIVLYGMALAYSFEGMGLLKPQGTFCSMRPLYRHTQGDFIVSISRELKRLTWEWFFQDILDLALPRVEGIWFLENCVDHHGRSAYHSFHLANRRNHPCKCCTFC